MVSQSLSLPFFFGFTLKSRSETQLIALVSACTPSRESPSDAHLKSDLPFGATLSLSLTSYSVDGTCGWMSTSTSTFTPPGSPGMSFVVSPSELRSSRKPSNAVMEVPAWPEYCWILSCAHDIH